MRTSSLLLLLALIALSACTGSPATLAMQPDFEIATSAGPASVSIRGAPPGMTDSEFERVVKTAMQAEMPGSLVTRLALPPFPARRIVWHVNPVPARGVSHLVVNVFDGSVPFAYKEEVVENGAPIVAVGYAVRSLTRRLLSVVDQQNQRSVAP
jgi:hypothetical protein